MKSPLLKLLCLVLSVFLMAGLYFLIWMTRPDYFRVQPGVNYLPLDLVSIGREYSAYSRDRKSGSPPLPSLPALHADEAAIKRIEDVYQQIQQASLALAKKKSDFAAREQEDALEYQAFEKSQWSQYESFIGEKTAPFVIRMNAIRERVQTLLSASGVKSPDDLPSGPLSIQYADLSVQLAQAEFERAKAEFEARDYGFKHLTDFQHQPAQREYLSRYDELSNVQKSIFSDEASFDKLHADLYDAFVDYRSVMNARLGYWDFVYFSVGAATTATFGDISPNSTTIRMLVCLQVLGSIIFTGLMVSQFGSRRPTGAVNTEPLGAMSNSGSENASAS
jgi:Ion channel